MRTVCRLPSTSASLSLRRMTRSICPALYMVSLARMTLMATSGMMPVSWSLLARSLARSTLLNTPL